MNLSLLRDETRAQHEATEALLPLNDPELTSGQYRQILQCFSAFVSGWERWASAHVPPQLAALLNERRRSALLEQDLAFFGLAQDFARQQDAAALDSLLEGFDADSTKREAAFLGSMYVLEGSTLGGQYIARAVERNLHLQPGDGNAYFRGYGDQTMAKWAEFRQLLEAIPEENAAIVIGAARVTFEYVQNILRSCSAAIG